MISAYLDRSEACRLMHDAYRLWATVTGPQAGVAFWRYTAALDPEEGAVEVYASLVGHVGDPAASDDDPSRPLAA
jgi:hypothetical protein